MGQGPSALQETLLLFTMCRSKSDKRRNYCSINHLGATQRGFAQCLSDPASPPEATWALPGTALGCGVHGPSLSCPKESPSFGELVNPRDSHPEEQNVTPGQKDRPWVLEVQPLLPERNNHIHYNFHPQTASRNRAGRNPAAV